MFIISPLFVISVVSVFNPIFVPSFPIYELKQDENNIYPDREKIATIEENRWYFSNQKLIRWICGKTFMEKTSNDFIKYDWYFSKIFYRYIDMFVNGNIEKNGAVLQR